jgi:hypothetical protein
MRIEQLRNRVVDNLKPESNEPFNCTITKFLNCSISTIA